MKKTRRRYDRKINISVVAELESGKPPVQIAREHSIYPEHLLPGGDELSENPENAFIGSGKLNR
jgi:transposase-like protein